jgi:NAD(P)-dependent dehydrogenase (short-subunit alcohol dehydrogenase family)
MAVADVTEKSIRELMSLEERVAVVTGAAKGIGAGIAARLAEAGAHLLLGDLDEPGAGAVADDLSARFGHKALAVPLDVSDGHSIRAAADRAIADFGRLDVWVNNAGIYPYQLALDMTDAEWDRVLDVNLRGAFIGSREAARRMIDAGNGGVIVNVASTAGYRAGGPGNPHYTSSKHGLLGLTKSFAVELGPFGIRVLAVAPTLIETPGIAQLAEGGEDGIGSLLTDLAARLPLGRAGVADDVARVVLLCATDMTSFMTGSSLLVDAGDIAL